LVGPDGSILKCDDGWYARLSGESLLHLALAEDATSNDKIYWTRALLIAALRPCVPH
jgi:hypothetical protein